MTLKRTTVHVEADDLDEIKKIASREGIPEAEIIREGVHLAAMSRRHWDEPMDIPVFDSGDPTFAGRVREILYGEQTAS